MGQFYKTSKPVFEDFMYKPPYELFKEVIQSKDKLVDNELASAAELSKYLNFNTLDFDKQEAESEKLRYMSQIEDVSNKIKKDPMNYQKYSQDILSLQKDLLQNFTTGKIGVMRGDYDKSLKFQEDHKNFKTKEGGRYTAGMNSFYNEAKARRESQLSSGLGYNPVWDSEQLMETKDFRKGFADFVKIKKPNITPIASTSSRGGYIFKTKGTEETLSADELQKLMQDYIMSTPDIENYVRQSSRIGLPEDFNNLTDFARSFAYNQTKLEKSQTTDAYALEEVKQANREKNIRLRSALKGSGKEDGDNLGGEILTADAYDMFGSNVLDQINNYKTSVGEEPISSSNRIIPYGLNTLVQQGLVSPKKAQALDSRIQSFTKEKDGSGFGENTIVFRPKVAIKGVNKNGSPFTYKPGMSYAMTVKDAKRTGLISEVAQGSGKPFYITPSINGVNYTFKNKNKNITVDGMLVPTGTYPSVKNGITFFSNETTEKE